MIEKGEWHGEHCIVVTWLDGKKFASQRKGDRLANWHGSLSGLILSIHTPKMDRLEIVSANCFSKTLHERKQFLFSSSLEDNFNLNFHGSSLKNANICLINFASNSWSSENSCLILNVVLDLKIFLVCVNIRIFYVVSAELVSQSDQSRKK